MSNEQGETEHALACINALGAQAHVEAPENIPHADGSAALDESDEIPPL
jgi:hypothetical protein